MDPEGDFVQMIPLNNADTVIITEDDLNDIREYIRKKNQITIMKMMNTTTDIPMTTIMTIVMNMIGMATK